MVVVGFTVMLAPRTAPIAGEMMLYVALLVVQARVVFPPDEMLDGVAVKLVMAGAAPVGAVALV